MTGRGIAEVVDEILSGNPQTSGLVINWQIFGSNGQEKADYSKGVLERFTRRAPKSWSARIPSGIFGGNIHVKTLANPRAINFISHPHYPIYFEGLFSVNENGKVVQGHDNNPVTAEKIVLNHYYAKSLEEFTLKQNRGRSDILSKYGNDWYDTYNRNDEFDDGILRYRAERAKSFRPPDKAHADERLFSALASNLSPTLVPTTPPQFYAGKMETFLTCRAVAAYLKTKLTDDKPAKFFEEASLNAVLKSMINLTFADAQLLLSELPNLLTLPYPAVNDLRGACLNIIPQMTEYLHLRGRWVEFAELNYIQRLLQTWK